VSRQFLIEKECTMGINATTTKYHGSIKEWWLHMSTERTLKFGIKRNARLFRNKHASTPALLSKIKHEARLWVELCWGSSHLVFYLLSNSSYYFLLN
jgi:hypothetical protein